MILIYSCRYYHTIKKTNLWLQFVGFYYQKANLFRDYPKQQPGLYLLRQPCLIVSIIFYHIRSSKFLFHCLLNGLFRLQKQKPNDPLIFLSMWKSTRMDPPQQSAMDPPQQSYCSSYCLDNICIVVYYKAIQEKMQRCKNQELSKAQLGLALYRQETDETFESCQFGEKQRAVRYVEGQSCLLICSQSFTRGKILQLTTLTLEFVLGWGVGIRWWEGEQGGAWTGRERQTSKHAPKRANKNAAVPQILFMDRQHNSTMSYGQLWLMGRARIVADNE